jgi:hypothetical protein
VPRYGAYSLNIFLGSSRKTFKSEFTDISMGRGSIRAPITPLQSRNTSAMLGGQNTAAPIQCESYDRVWVLKMNSCNLHILNTTHAITLGITG